MSRRTLRTELRLTFGLLLAVVAVVGLGGVVATTVTDTYVSQATRRVAPAQQANSAILQSLTDAQTGLRGYVLSGRPVALAPYHRALRRLPGERAQLQRFFDHDAEARGLMTAQERAIATWLDDYAGPRLRQPVGPGTFSPQRFARGERLFDQVRAHNAAVARHLRVHLDRLQADAENVRGLMTAGVVALTFAGLVVGVSTIRLTSRRVRRPLAALRDVLTDLIAGDHEARAVPGGPHEVATIARSVNALADETDRLRSAEAEERRRQERLLALGRLLRTSLDPDEVVRLGLAELGDTLRLDRAYVRLVEDGELHDIGQQWHVSELDALTALATPGSISALRAIHARRRPLTTTDVRADAFFDTDRGRDWATRTGARGSMTLPIPVGDVPVGVITCIDLRPREWTDSEIRLAEAVAADLGRALEHARLYTAQVQAVQRLEELDRAKDEFMSSVSHELRTPLTSISGYLELLEDEDAGPVTPQQRRLLAVVRRNANRLRALIEDLLTLSRIESGAFRSTLAETDLVALVQTALDDMSPQAGSADVAVHSDLPAHPVPVQADPGQLSRALLNVIGNALKFTPAGGRVDVRVVEQPDGGGVAVEVTDTGIGIPGTDLDRLFTRFFRASNAVAAEVPGTGLGLVIARTIMDNHGGSLDLSSRQGHGTTVRMRLPYSPTAGEAAGSGIGRGGSAF